MPYDPRECTGVRVSGVAINGFTVVQVKDDKGNIIAIPFDKEGAVSFTKELLSAFEVKKELQ